MGLADLAIWCVACGRPPTVAISVERHGVIAHFGSCDEHIAVVAERVRGLSGASGEPVGEYTGLAAERFLDATATD